MSRGLTWLALPYGVALSAFLTEVFAGGAAGAEVMPIFWIIRVLTILALGGWVVALAMAARRTGWLSLATLPSALIIWAIDQDIPLLIGGCTLAHACV